MDRKFAIVGLIYAVLGMLLGIVMAATHDHGQLVTHAHIMLLGFVVTFIYALCHKLWLTNGNSLLARVQFYMHQVGVIALLSGLFLLYGKFASGEKLEPLLSGGSLLVLVSLITMVFLFIRSDATRT